MKNYPTDPLPLIRGVAANPRGPIDSFHGLNSNDRAAHEEILGRAYLLWENEGYPQNRALANWLQAETEVMGSN